MPDRRPLHLRVPSSHDVHVACDQFQEYGHQEVLPHLTVKSLHVDLFLCERVALKDVWVQIIIHLFNEELARAFQIPAWILLGYASREEYERYHPDKATGRDLDELAALSGTRR